MIPTGSVPASDPNFSGYAVEFRNQVEFLKKLSMMSWADATEERKAAEAELQKDFSRLNEAFEDYLDALTFRDFRKPDDALMADLSRAGIFLYLMEKTGEFHEAALKLNKEGLYDLMDEARSWTFDFISLGYGKGMDELMKQYLGVESQFVALSELTGVDLVPIYDASSAYQEKIFRRLTDLAKASAKPAGPEAPAAPGSAPAKGAEDSGTKSAEKPETKKPARKKSSGKKGKG